MITVLTGQNSFRMARALDDMKRDFDGTPETLDGSDIMPEALPDLLAGGTLFASQRLVIIKGLSDNAASWMALPDVLPRASEDIHLVLVEPKPDKRVRTYKELQKNAQIKDFQPLTERDRREAEQLVRAEGKRRGVTLDGEAVSFIVESARISGERPGEAVIDEWRLVQAVEIAGLMDAPSAGRLAEVIEADDVENVFRLLEAALTGDKAALQGMVARLKAGQDPYQTLGLLGGQAFQLAVLVHAEGRAQSDVARDLAANPYALRSLALVAGRLSKARVQLMIEALAEADSDLKESKGEPWLLIERAFYKITA